MADPHDRTAIKTAGAVSIVQAQSARNRGLEVEMNKGETGARQLLERAKAELPDEDQNRAPSILAEIAELGAANTKANVANTTA